jgi:hypothetical protein
VDRSTISTFKRLARDGAIAALQSRPGRKPAAQERTEAARLQAEIDRLTVVVVD